MSQFDELPEGWKICTFEDLFDFKGGSQPPKSAFADEEKPGYIRLLQIRDFESDKLAVFIKDEKRWPKCDDDDILIARYGASLGRICSGKKGAYNVALVKIIFDKLNLNRDWVELFLKSKWFQDPLFLVSRSAQSGFNKAEVFPRPVPLPPLNEQRRIVEKIEALTARSRKARAALDEIPALLDQFRQSVLAAAFRGDLTVDWRAQNPDVEPAEALLERIRVERHTCWEEYLLSKSKNPKKSKYKKSEETIGQEKYELPKSWCWMTLSDVAWYVKDGPHYSPKYSDSGIPFITGGNVKSDGVDFENVKYISSELHEELSSRCVPEYGDILYTKGGTTGIARVNTYRHEFNVWVHVAVLKCVPSIEKFYLQHALNSPCCYQQSQRFTHGVGNQDLGLTRMVKILIPLAPQAEQVEIIRRIEIYMQAINNLQRQFEDFTENVEQLDQSILAKAFRGELVPQDPNDEPAAVLLDRIRAERERLGSGKKRGKAKA